MSTLDRMLRDAKVSAGECDRILQRVSSAVNCDDISRLRAAANQAAQAALEINQLIGYLYRMSEKG